MSLALWDHTVSALLLFFVVPELQIFLGSGGGGSDECGYMIHLSCKRLECLTASCSCCSIIRITGLCCLYVGHGDYSSSLQFAMTFSKYWGTKASPPLHLIINWWTIPCSLNLRPCTWRITAGYRNSCMNKHRAYHR